MWHGDLTFAVSWWMVRRMLRLYSSVSQLATVGMWQGDLTIKLSWWTARQVLRLNSSVGKLATVRMYQGDLTLKLSWRAAWRQVIVSEGTPEAEATFSRHLVMMRMKARRTILCRYCTWCQLMIMLGRDGVGWLKFVFCDDNRVVDETERWGWRWERCGGYERIWEIRGTTCLIGLG